jgi:5-methyltetrahydrofolate--homocysteine methyltransferase
MSKSIDRAREATNRPASVYRIGEKPEAGRVKEFPDIRTRFHAYAGATAHRLPSSAMTTFTELTNAVAKGNRNETKRLIQVALDANTQACDIVEKGLVPGMALIGEKFKCNEAFVPEMLIAARAMKEGMAILEPLLVKAGIQPKYRAVIGTVQGDLHDIGKNLVAMMWRGANIGVIDLGTNVPADKFIEAAKQNNAHIIGLSALLTTTMPAMKETVAACKGSGLSGKVLVGGAPVTKEFATQIGADGFAADAASAVDMVMELVGK